MVEVLLVENFYIDNQIFQQKSPPPSLPLQGCTPLSTIAPEIRSSTLDFRDDAAAKIVPVELPDTVAADCIKLARTLKLTMTGIDLRRTPEGEYVFFEGNPAPMFMHFENMTGYPISDRLVEMLAKGR